MPTARRAIAVFPAFGAADAIESLRRRYDPLAAAIPAHVTLVFPFESDLSTTELSAHMRAAAAMRPFRLVLQEVTGHNAEYLSLNIKRGGDALIALHDRLYGGALARQGDPAFTYLPHVTVGRLANAAAFRAALADAGRLTDRFATVVREVCCYTIAPDGRREIACRVALAG